jgi:predicted SPOUT superfamily RNA methylase MTH1
MPKKDAVIFDLNNTLRKKSGKPRHSVLKKAKKDEKKEQVVVVSGEPNKNYNEARGWLDSHNLSNAMLDMRPKNEKEPDSIEKAHLLTHRLSKQFKIKKAYDDKPSNVKMFKSHGIKAKEV